jgi:ribonuclease HI
MQVTREFIELGIVNSILNKAQCKILGLSYPIDEEWQELEVNKELSLKETNLFLFLRGDLTLQVQEQIIKNYELVANFHKQQNREKEEPKKILKANSVTIYCDGACKGNPGKAGSGLAIYTENKKPTLLYGKYNPRGTNNTAELNALYKALLIASEYKKAIIKTDSKYSMDCITKWAYSWKRNRWTKKGGEIKNLKIIQLSHELYEQLKDRVTIEYVKGHAGVEGNELADRMAGLAIAKRKDKYCEYSYKNITKILKMKG